jgi:hypothetical protein
MHNTRLEVKYMKVINDGKLIILTTGARIPVGFKGDRL